MADHMLSSRRTFLSQCCGIAASALGVFPRSGASQEQECPPVEELMEHVEALLTTHPDVERLMRVRPRHNRRADIGFTLFEQLHWYADPTQ